jgi:CsoR family transcriptional regulator, copper-sensing transcriptional repressor
MILSGSMRNGSHNHKRNVPPPARLKPAPRAKGLERELLNRLSRAEGQLRGVQKMVAGDAYCIDVLQQISAVKRALDKIALILLRDHLGTCVSDAMAARNASAKIRELIETLDRFLG